MGVCPKIGGGQPPFPQHLNQGCPHPGAADTGPVKRWAEGKVAQNAPDLSWEGMT